MWGILSTKKQHPRDTVSMYLCQQRAVQSPEPEGSEMMLHHSAWHASRKNKKCKVKCVLSIKKTPDGIVPKSGAFFYQAKREIKRLNALL